ncbi:MAG: helix-turn-helix domain-containing protein [Cloacibacillus sp.]
MLSKKDEPDTAAKILSAAVTLISQAGYANVSMRDIAKRAGVALSHLNYYYENKEGLFLAVIKNVKESYLKELTLRLSAPSPEEKNNSFLFAHAKESMRNTTYIFRLLLDLSNLALWSEPFRKEFNSLIDDVAEVLAAYESSDMREASKQTAHRLRQKARFFLAINLGISAQYLADAENRDDTLEIFDFIGSAMK